MPRTTCRLDATDAGFAEAARLLAARRLVAFPTETVYGLGGDATDDRTVAEIYAAKDRPSFNPLIVHVPSLDAATRVGVISGDALRLAEAFWPGPLTMVVPLRPEAGISRLVTAGLDTVALRVPAHPAARRLLAEAGCPVAAPSANPSGRISPTTADHVLSGLAGRIDAVLDAGPCPVGVESTIVGFTPGGPILLRAGGLPTEAIEDCLGLPLGRATVDPAAPSAPGQLASHYAPRARLRLDVTTPAEGEAFLGFGPDPSGVTSTLNLSRSGNLTEAAANLFAHLHRLDEMGFDRIGVAPIPGRGLGRAINDRLVRAAAPRP